MAGDLISFAEGSLLEFPMKTFHEPFPMGTRSILRKRRRFSSRVVAWTREHRRSPNLRLRFLAELVHGGIRSELRNSNPGIHSKFREKRIFYKLKKFKEETETIRLKQDFLFLLRSRSDDPELVN